MSLLDKYLNSDLSKAAHGRYADTAKNRRLHRVGQEYGHAAKEKVLGPGRKPAQQDDEQKNPLAAKLDALSPTQLSKIVDMADKKIQEFKDKGYEQGIQKLEEIAREARKRLMGDEAYEKYEKEEAKKRAEQEQKEKSTEEPVEKPAEEPKADEKPESTGDDVKVEARMTFDDIPNSGKVKMAKYLSGARKNKVDSDFKAIKGLDDATVQTLHDGLVKKFNDGFDDMRKADRAEALYKIAKVKNELQKRFNTSLTMG